jgi:hypothetical protein
MDSGHLTALTSGNDVSVLSTSDINCGDIILMDWPLWKVLVGVLVFLTSSEESLLSSGKILDNTKCSSGEHDLVIILSEVKAGFVSITSETVYMVDFVSTVWSSELGWVCHSSGWWLLSDLLQKELFLWGFC